MVDVLVKTAARPGIGMAGKGYCAGKMGVPVQNSKVSNYIAAQSRKASLFSEELHVTRPKGGGPLKNTFFDC